jgi:hypothetical protein
LPFLSEYSLFVKKTGSQSMHRSAFHHYCHTKEIQHCSNLLSSSSTDFG